MAHNSLSIFRAIAVVLPVYVSSLQLIVVCIRPAMKVLVTHTVRADQRSLPSLSWQFVIIQLSENLRIMDPVLAFARDHSVHFYQVSCDTMSRCAVAREYRYAFVVSWREMA